jgi:Hint domain
MATSINYGGSVYTSPGTSGFSNTDGTVTAFLSDGAISVGDDVVFSGFSPGGLAFGGVGDTTGFYLGSSTFNGVTGYVFGNSNTVDSNTSFFVVFTGDVDPSTAAAVNQWRLSPTALNTSDAACFAAGTRIATSDGEVAVETLCPGDIVLTAAGDPVAVKWLGRQSVHRVFAGPRLQLIVIHAGALGDGLPHSNLTVTADHAVLVDGILCNAGALVNGATIIAVPRKEMDERFSVYHVETEDHAIIRANGAAAETFIDNISRRVFDNYAEFEAMYGDVPEMRELPYPRAMSARQLPDRILRMLASARVA